MNTPRAAPGDATGQRALLLSRNRLGAASLIVAGLAVLLVRLSMGEDAAQRWLGVAFGVPACVWGAVMIRSAAAISNRGILATAAVAQFGLTGMAFGSPSFEVSTGILGYVYLWTSAYVAYYFPWRYAVPYVAGTLACYVGWLALTTPLRVGIPRGVAEACLLGVLVFGLGRYRDKVNYLLHELRWESRHDALTGLLNRRGFLEAGEALVADAGRRHGTVALLALDLDHFKLLNDRYGHPAGDTALASFGGLIRDRCRPGDLAGRLGGEEFAVLLPDTGTEAAMMIAERLRGAAAGMPAARPLTVSQGVAVLHVASAGSPEDWLADLLRRADQAMYHAKADGRDRISVDGTPSHRVVV
jgi:diguanylate cyclase (GGDEF)-like protein